MRTYDRGDFDGSIAFVNAIAAAANAADHHPDLALSWNRVTVRLSSHDAGGITERDLRLAAQIDALATIAGGFFVDGVTLGLASAQAPSGFGSTHTIRSHIAGCRKTNFT